MNANGEPERLIQPRRAAQATTAGAVKDRKPAMIPIQNARRSVTPELIELDPESESQRLLRKFIMSDRKTFSVKDWISIFFSSLRALTENDSL